MRHKQIKLDLVQETIDLINSYNLSKEMTVNLVRNSNEFDPHPPENLTYGVGERDPNKLYNHFSNMNRISPSGIKYKVKKFL